VRREELLKEYGFKVKDTNFHVNKSAAVIKSRRIISNPKWANVRSDIREDEYDWYIIIGIIGIFFQK